MLARHHPVSKKLNHKDRVKNIVALLGESISSSWNKFTSFLRIFPNYYINDESLKEYFYQGQDDNDKAVLDTIAGDYYRECPYAEIAEKLEKTSKIIKLGALGSQTLGETLLKCNLHTTNPYMRFLKKWIK